MLGKKLAFTVQRFLALHLHIPGQRTTREMRSALNQSTFCFAVALSSMHSDWTVPLKQEPH